MKYARNNDILENGIIKHPEGLVMKNIFKKAISVLLIAVMVLCSAPLSGFVGLELPEIGGLGKLADSVSEFFAGFGNKAEASSEVFDYELDENGNATITGFDYSLAGDLVIPSTIDGYLVTALGDWSFSWSDISSVVIPEGVISIGGAAFQGCYNLVDVSIPNSVRYIYSNAFQECINLSKIDIPEGVKEIWTEAFSYCERLASVTLPDSLEMVAENAFMETAIYLNEDNWENGVLYIDNYLIEANKSIEGSYSIKEGTTGIAYNSFYGSDKLTNIIFPEGLKYIGDSAFYQCSSLESVTLSDELKKIYDSAFFQCSSLKSIIFPVGLNYIGHKAFYSAPLTDAYYIGSEFQWAKIEIGEMNPSLSNVVFLSDGIGLVPVEGSTTVIERGGNSFDDWFVYGLKTRLRDTALSDYITVKGDGYYEAIPVYVSYFGTGSVINVYNSETNELLESFNVVIFGDINGDSMISSADASIIYDEIVEITSWSDPDSEDYSPYMQKAGDLNHNGEIDFYDYAIVENHVLGILNIDQTTGQVERYGEEYYIFYYVY